MHERENGNKNISWQTMDVRGVLCLIFSQKKIFLSPGLCSHYGTKEYRENRIISKLISCDHVEVWAQEKKSEGMHALVCILCGTCGFRYG